MNLCNGWTFVEFNKQQLEQNKNLLSLNNLSILVYAYLKLTENIEGYNYIVVDDLCQSLGYSIKTHNQNGYAQQIIDYLKKCIETNGAELIPTTQCKTLNDISRTKMMKMHFVETLRCNEYIRLDYQEFLKIQNCSIRNNIRLHKLLNLYIALKAYVNMNDTSLHICFPSEQTLADTLCCNVKTVRALLNALHQDKIIYKQTIQRHSLHSSEEHSYQVYSLQEYDLDDIQKFFTKK